MSMFSGVFAPATIGLVGPSLFLRLAGVLADAGFATFAIIIAGIMIIALMTVSGVSGTSAF